MGSEHRYWKADKETSAKIKDLLKGWEAVLKKGTKLAKSVGARNCYTNTGFTERYVAGFLFPDESKVDKKNFIRIKGTPDGWKPRARTPLHAEMESLRSNAVGEVMALIGMKLFGKGMSIRTPGIDHGWDGHIYLVTPADVKPKFCVRVSDMEYEAAISKKERMLTK